MKLRSQRVLVDTNPERIVVRFDWSAADAVRFSLWLLWQSLGHWLRGEPAGFTSTSDGPIRCARTVNGMEVPPVYERIAIRIGSDQ